MCAARHILNFVSPVMSISPGSWSIRRLSLTPSLLQEGKTNGHERAHNQNDPQPPRQGAAIEPALGLRDKPRYTCSPARMLSQWESAVLTAVARHTQENCHYTGILWYSL